ncbi:MAG: hypothetical protein IJ802_03335 [Kiritimatiellae bacterium]|nr:hypothetical protein [Kiritimatiellia bacterium]
MGGSVFSIAGGCDIISVCKKSGDGMNATNLMKAAVEAGGDRLDSFDGNHAFYRRCGFEPVSWTPFNEQYAPEGWTKGRDRPEDVVFYAYTGNRQPDKAKAAAELAAFKNATRPCTGENGYDEAMKKRNDFMARRKSAK